MTGASLLTVLDDIATAVVPMLLNGVIGILAGLIVVAVWSVIEKVRGK